MISDSANLRSEFILHLILDEDIVKATNRVAVGHLIAACDLTLLRRTGERGHHRHVCWADHQRDRDKMSLFSLYRVYFRHVHGVGYRALI